MTTTENDGGDAVSVVRFSHPTLDAPAQRPADAQELAPVQFLAPAGLAETEQHEPADRYPSRRAPIGDARPMRRSTRPTR